MSTATQARPMLDSTGTPTSTEKGLSKALPTTFNMGELANGRRCRRAFTGPRATVENRQASMEEWFAGFRHGAASARQSGIRTLILMPTTTSVPVVASPESTNPTPTQPEGANSFVLPTPRVIEPPLPVRPN